MANTDVTRGFVPVMHISGAPWNGQTMKMYKAAGTTVTDDLMPGDMVVTAATADADGIIGIARATAGDTQPSCGVIVSCEPLAAHLDRTWIDGADAGYVNVCTDPYVVFEGQADDVIAAASVGTNANMVQTAVGSRTTGASGQEVDATVNTTYTYQLKIIGIVRRPDNTINSANNKVLVLINNHQFKGATGTAGI
ncbi:MAG: hypothetical protein ABIG30_00805 [Candidatus Aenigmatarchaeota archaeon]